MNCIVYCFTRAPLGHSFVDGNKDDIISSPTESNTVMSPSHDTPLAKNIQMLVNNSRAKFGESEKAFQNIVQQLQLISMIDQSITRDVLSGMTTDEGNMAAPTSVDCRIFVKILHCAHCFFNK